jgi:hypothetical protein
VFGHVPAASAADAQRALGGDDRPEAVPLQFVAVVAARRQSPGAREHRFGKGAIRRQATIHSGLGYSDHAGGPPWLTCGLRLRLDR